jgi:hypothetical protein
VSAIITRTRHTESESVFASFLTAVCAQALLVCSAAVRLFLPCRAIFLLSMLENELNRSGVLMFGGCLIYGVC